MIPPADRLPPMVHPENVLHGIRPDFAGKQHPDLGPFDD
jgi:hypothetical protein